MTILLNLLHTLNSERNANRERTILVTTSTDTFEGEFIAADAGTLQIAVYGQRSRDTTGPTGNDLLIPEREIRLIEIDWKDTYGLVNGDEAARIAYDAARAPANLRKYVAAVTTPDGIDELAPVMAVDAKAARAEYERLGYTNISHITAN